MTLIELLMVMGLIALMLGFGIGAITSLDLGNYGTGSQVRSSLRAASNWSRTRQAPARVLIDPAAGTIAAEGLAVIGTWHFEKAPPEGAFDLDGQLLDAELVDGGYVGKALGLAGMPPGASYEVPVHTDPAFSLTAGFQVQVVLRPEGTRGGRLIVLGDSLKLEATSRFGLRATMATQRYDEQTGRPKSAGKAVLETSPGVLAPNRWNRVLVTYDRAKLRVFVDGLEVAGLDEEGDVVPVRAKMVLGGGQRPWEGALDGLVISAVGAEGDFKLPEGVQFAADVPTEIAFDAGGGLDRAQHEGPVLIGLEYDDGREDTVRVNLYGTVE
jgi:hypothetical protein